MKNRRTLFQASLACLTLAAAGALPLAHAQDQDPLKVGFVYVSPIGDAGWTYQHDLGRKQMEEALGDKVTTTFVESVSEGAMLSASSVRWLQAAMT